MISWHEETLHGFAKEALRVDEELHGGRTAFQSVRVFRNEGLGLVMTLDDVVQTTEADEFIYHEMLAHPAIHARGGTERVLIIGGGDGGCAREVLRHAVERVVMVELDGEVVALAREHMPSLSAGAFEDPRLELVIGDGAAYVADGGEAFDLIIVDSTDPIGPGAILFEAPFQDACRRRLTADGIVVTQNGVPFLQRREFVHTRRIREGLFRHSGFFFASVPTYFGGDMAFGWGSDAIDMAAGDLETIRARHRASGLATRYYNPEIHLAAFACPSYLRPGGSEGGALV